MAILQKQGIFGNDRKAQAAVQIPETQAADDIGRRLRTLEERFSTINRKLEVIEGSQLKDFRKLHTEVKASNADILELRNDYEDLKQKIMLIIKELQSSAKKEEVDVLKRYLDLWHPVNFVTQNEIEGIVKRVVEGLQERKI